MKSNQDVIGDFNEYVNMTASELESWLKSDEANSAGWPKADDDGDGESVGHDSGRRIVEILKSNPDKDPEGYTDEQVQHMRKVAAYCKRHLAQETKSNENKSADEVKQTKSYASLKNWGHDFLKARGEGNGDAGAAEQETEDSEEVDGAEGDGEDEGEGDAEKKEEEVDDGASTKQAGEKRKKSGHHEGSSKKRETRSSTAARKQKTLDNEDDGGADDGDVDEEDEEGQADDNAHGQDSEKQQKGGKKTGKGPAKGDTVSWNWGNGQPEGKVLDVQGEKTSVTTKRGNQVSRKGKPDDPAVVLDTGKSKAIKFNHELNETED